MEAYRIERFGNVDGIVLRSSEDPRPGLKEVLMRVRASSLNYRDLMVLKGGGRGPTKSGVVPLSAHSARERDGPTFTTKRNFFVRRLLVCLTQFAANSRDR
jgi:hypothetical protein